LGFLEWTGNAESNELNSSFAAPMRGTRHGVLLFGPYQIVKWTPGYAERTTYLSDMGNCDDIPTAYSGKDGFIPHRPYLQMV
jgi:hypothetical protein